MQLVNTHKENNLTVQITVLSPRDTHNKNKKKERMI